jgi:hypothetical protein
MPITILDYVKSVTGAKDLYTVEDFLAAGVDMLGGCQLCGATIACYNAYPSVTGYWRCTDCIGDLGYPTITAFTTATSTGSCPTCGNPDTIREITIPSGEDTEEPALQCGDCGQVWQP